MYFQQWETQFHERSFVSDDVLRLVSTLWNESLGALERYLSVPVSEVRPRQVEKAEAVLLEIRRLLKCEKPPQEALQQLSDEFYRLLPHVERQKIAICDVTRATRKSNLCQLVRGVLHGYCCTCLMMFYAEKLDLMIVYFCLDMVSVSEGSGWKRKTSAHAKLSALHCNIRHLTQNSDEFEEVAKLFNAR